MSQAWPLLIAPGVAGRPPNSAVLFIHTSRGDRRDQCY